MATLFTAGAQMDCWRCLQSGSTDRIADLRFSVAAVLVAAYVGGFGRHVGLLAARHDLLRLWSKPDSDVVVSPDRLAIRSIKG